MVVGYIVVLVGFGCGTLANTQPDAKATIITLDPLENPKDMGPSPLDIDALMNQPEHATLFNYIIDRIRETIMVNFQRDNVSVFGFG